MSKGTTGYLPERNGFHNPSAKVLHAHEKMHQKYHITNGWVVNRSYFTWHREGGQWNLGTTVMVDKHGKRMERDYRWASDEVDIYRLVYMA